jgi:hypothetical protein
MKFFGRLMGENWMWTVEIPKLDGHRLQMTMAKMEF